MLKFVLEKTPRFCTLILSGCVRMAETVCAIEKPTIQNYSEKDERVKEPTLSVRNHHDMGKMFNLKENTGWFEQNHLIPNLCY